VSLKQDRKGLKMLIAAVAGFVAVTVIPAQVAADAMVEKAIIDRIKPIGEVNVGSAPVAAAAPSGGAVQGLPAICAGCHDAGVAGAPKVGDKAAWKNRITQGVAGLVKSVLNGKGAMPPKGGSSMSEDEIKSVVEYMVKNSK
jgi:cytochrome c5